MITIEQSTVERRIVYIDSLGYAYCPQCRHEISRPCSPGQPDGPCDLCGGNNFAEIVTGTAVIEHISVKVF